MFLGHFGLAFAAKRLAPRTSLGALGAASQWVDLVWPVLVLAGIEQVRIAPGDTAYTPLAFVHYPWTHSLLMSIAWAIAFGLLYRAAGGERRGAIVVGLLVASHWFLDWATHRPDLQLVPWAPERFGLGLWNSVAATVLVEGAIFAGGVWLYATGTRPRSRSGSVALVEPRRLPRRHGHREPVHAPPGRAGGGLGNHLDVAARPLDGLGGPAPSARLGRHGERATGFAVSGPP